MRKPGKVSKKTPSPQSFRRLVYEQYRRKGRVLPWRATRDPYAILVSELMLQQTQVSRVLPKYEAFLKRLPTFEALAQAKFSDVLLLWQGLGYNRRAKALHDIAKEVTRTYQGKLPREKALLRQLPGIGSYTASAILVFAHNIPAVMIETNIRTVYTHFFFPRKRTVADAELLPLIESTMDRKNPRRWFSALMDYGAYLKGSGIRINSHSAHYVRQSKFEGSRRQLRGALLRLILKKPQTISALAKGSGRSATAVREELVRLQKEKLITKKGKQFSIAK